MEALERAPEADEATIVHHIETEVVTLIGDVTNLAPGGAGARGPPGDLLISEESVTWWSEAGGTGFELRYPSLALHAISRDGGVASGAPCIYCQVYRPGGDGETDELRLIPADRASLDTIYAALSECQALYPDEDEGDDGVDAAAELFFANALGAGGANGNGGGGHPVYDDADADADVIFADADEEMQMEMGMEGGRAGSGGGEVGGDDGHGGAELLAAASAGMFAPGEVELTPDGMATMERLSNLLIVEDGVVGDSVAAADGGQFDDAD
mmetsp:Transcript_35786/g.93639  ORF Transcript_35786/g.93639 Transcript_35786/m.93639 type:complete len:270 (+) Transcript_35786:131-940(+)